MMPSKKRPGAKHTGLDLIKDEERAGAPAEVIPFHNDRLSIKELTGTFPSLYLAHNQILFNALERTGSIWILEDALGERAGN